MSAPSEPPKRTGPGMPWLALAIVLAPAIGVGSALGGVGETSLTQLPLRLSQGSPQSVTEAPRVLPSLRLGGWPAARIEAEATKGKSPVAASTLPAIAIVIDDCGVDEVRTRI